MRLVIDDTDRRMDYLAELLTMNGHEVTKLANADFSAPCALVLSPAKKGFIELVEKLACGSAVFCGNDVEVSDYCIEHGIRHVSFMDDTDFAQRNAEATAESACALVISHTDSVLSDSCTAIVGFGRIGKALCMRLNALHADIHVFCSSKSEYEHARRLHYPCYLLTELCSMLSTADIVVNTVPAYVISNSCVDVTKRTCRFIELASPPYGYSHEYVRSVGRTHILAAGLPAHYCPRSAALYMLSVIEKNALEV